MTTGALLFYFLKGAGQRNNDGFQSLKLVAVEREETFFCTHTLTLTLLHTDSEVESFVTLQVISFVLIPYIL